MTYNKEYTLHNDICQVTKEYMLYQQGRADAIDEVSRAMYHQCFECDNDEDMQK